MSTSRRKFLKSAGLTILGCGLAQSMPKHVSAAALKMMDAVQVLPGNGILVVINLQGGNDGLNTVIPLGEYSLYAALRPNLKIPQANVLTLGDAPSFGFNPSMTSLKTLYDMGKVAVLPGVGVPHNSVSKFDHAAGVYDFVSADPLHQNYSSNPTGWLGRYAETTAPGVIPSAVDIGGGSLLLKGPSQRPLSIGSISQFQFKVKGGSSSKGTPELAAYTDIMAIRRGDSAIAELNRSVRQDALTNSQTVQDSTANYHPVTYPNTGLANQLKQVAQLIWANLGVRAFSVSTGGFDTHQAQNTGSSTPHNTLLQNFSDAVSAFYNDLKSLGLQQNVVMLTISDFGRRPNENSDIGTDHGYGSVSFAIGDPVKGGVWGNYPSLASNKLVFGGNLDVTTDYRSMFATVLANLYDTDPLPIVGMDMSQSLAFI